MLQKYQNLLIHINMFQELYNIGKDKLYLHEMYYRYILEYLYPNYNLSLLCDLDKEKHETLEVLGFFRYFRDMYMPSKEIYTEEDIYRIMQKAGCSENRMYLALGRNTNMELDAAERCYIHTCKLIENYDLNANESTYKISSFEKIKTIL